MKQAWRDLSYFFAGPLLRPALVSLLIISLSVNLLMLVPTVYMLQIFDRVLLSGNALTLLAVSIITLYLFGLLALSEWLRARVLVRLAASFDHQYSTPLFLGVLQSQAFSPAALGQAPKTMEVQAQRGFTALIELRQFLISPVVQALLDLPFTPLFVLVLYLLHPVLGFFALAFFGVQVVVGALGHNRVLPPQAQSSLALAAENRFLQASLKHSDTAQAMAMSTALTQNWQSLREVTLETYSKAQSLAAGMSSLSKFMRYLQQGLSLGLGAYLVIEGELSPGAMIAANVLTSRALAPIDQLAGSWRQILGAGENLQTVQTLAKEGGNAESTAQTLNGRGLSPTASLSASGSLPIPVKSAKELGGIRIKKLTLFTPGHRKPIFQDLDFSLVPGTTTALIGPSGSGKTSLLKAMVGLWPQDLLQGELWLGPVQAGFAKQRAIAPLIGYLPQEVDLFEATVAQNIARMAAPDPEAVVQAAKAMSLHNAILSLPMGYDTVIPMQGFLPAGFRQRLGLARALYGKPGLLLLDEPSASLDEAAEKALVQTLRSLQSQGVSIVLATHRQSLIDCAHSQINLSLHNPTDHATDR